jgi:hypothetical protein
MRHKFNYISFQQKHILDKEKIGYKVYTSKDEFVFVNADTAFEAIMKSGHKNPYKLERVGLVKKSLFSEKEVS